MVMKVKTHQRIYVCGRTYVTLLIARCGGNEYTPNTLHCVAA